MDVRLVSIMEATDISKKYQLVIEYLEENGLLFKNAFPDHINNHYRIFEGNSSIFVLESGFKMNLSDIDKRKLESLSGIVFTPCYKNKRDGIVDNVRPWTITFSDIEDLERITKCLIGQEQKTGDINIPKKPNGYDDSQNVICPNCDYHFIKATRCPECGQYIDYAIAERTKFREKYRDEYKKYFEERTTQERAEAGKEPLKSLNTNISDVFLIEDICVDKPFSYWLESEECLEEARQILTDEFSRRGRKNPQSDAKQYIRNMRYFKDFYNGIIK